jgi:hypothetical protein
MGNVILSTGDIRRDYEIIDTVFAYGSSHEGFLKSANPIEAYQKVGDVLKQNAKKKGADGIVFTTFDYRVAVKSGCMSSGQSFEVFAYGTAIKFKIQQ